MRSYVAGVDEVGCGCLAGPVVAAAVVLKDVRDIQVLEEYRLYYHPNEQPFSRLIRDSKKMSPIMREAASAALREHYAYDYSVGFSEVDEIDRYGVVDASLLAMMRAVMGLRTKPVGLKVDGVREVPRLEGIAQQVIIRGDTTEKCISAASIIAKVARDHYMVDVSPRFPDYRFADNKGYPSPAHLRALYEWGPCDIHRISTAPVRRAIELQQDRDYRTVQDGDIVRVEATLEIPLDPLEWGDNSYEDVVRHLRLHPDALHSLWKRYTEQARMEIKE